MSVPQSAREIILPKRGSFQNLTFRDKKVEEPKDDEVLVKVHAVSLQYRDLVTVTGDYYGKQVAGHEVLPDLVPGSDMAGEVVAIGKNVETWKVGDRVCSNFSTEHIYGDPTPFTLDHALGGPSHGVLTEYRTFPAYSLVAIPKHLSYEEASTLPCAALTAYNALFGGVQVKPGDYVLVQGTGGVSIFGLQLALASGAIIIATSSSDEKLHVASKLGAHHLINYRKTPNWEEEALKITGGVGVDHILEVGGQGTFAKSVKAARIGGHIHVIGFVSKDGSESESGIVMNTLVKALHIRGIRVGSVSQFKDLNRLLAARPKETKPVIDSVFSFEDTAKAYEHLYAQKHVGKVVIKVSKN